MKRTIEVRVWGGNIRDMEGHAILPVQLGLPQESIVAEGDYTVPVVLKAPPLEPGQRLMVAVKWSREYEDTPGKRLYEALYAMKLVGEDMAAWAELSPERREKYEKIAAR